MELALLPVLQKLHAEKNLPWDAQTGLTLARLIHRTPSLHEGHIAHVTDKLTGNVPDRRYSVFDVDAIDNPAAYAYGALRRYGDYDDCGLPATYEELQGTAGW